MAIRITEDGTVIYENEPNVERELFPNIQGCCAELRTEIGELKENLSDLQELAGTKAAAIYETASGEIASFSDGADDMPIKSCVVSIDPIQEGEGDPSPENVRPISGRTGVTVSHSGADTSDPVTISVNWETEAGTVYGGYMDVVSGKLMVDRVAVTMDGSQGDILESQNSRFYKRYQDAKIVNTSNQGSYAGVISERFKSYTWGGLANVSIGCAPVYGSGIAFKHPDINTVADWETYFTNNPTVFSYELATPTEIQLTPQEIRTLLGENNIWSDGGDVEVEYPADTKTYIDTKIAQAVAAAMA